MNLTNAESCRKYYLKNKEKARQRVYQWRKHNKEKHDCIVRRSIEKWNEKNPITFFFSRKLRNIRSRCNNPNKKAYRDYGARGIKCILSWQELRILWLRDKADLMNRPTIHRFNNDGDYIFTNCEYIEWKDHRKINHKRFDTKKD